MTTKIEKSNHTIKPEFKLSGVIIKNENNDIVDIEEALNEVNNDRN